MRLRRLRLRPTYTQLRCVGYGRYKAARLATRLVRRDR